MERPHILLYGKVNAGKSTLFNLLLRQPRALVSPHPGTTTDVLAQATELIGLGPVLLIDTPGIDDASDLGALRMQVTARALQEADLILYVLESPDDYDPHLAERYPHTPIIPVEPRAGIDLGNLLAAIAEALGKDLDAPTITGNLVRPGDLVLLVMPQDQAAPKGRLILPQVQTLRELLDKHCTIVCAQPDTLPQTLARLAALPQLVITDSQAFRRVRQLLPPEVPLTSFSILMATYKGSLPELADGAKALDRLTGHSRVLIAEACTHTPATEDIGTVKLPRLLRSRFGPQLAIDHVHGRDFPRDLSGYDLIIHCGACMFNRKLLLARQQEAAQQGIPMTNYGLAIAHLQGLDLRGLALPTPGER